MTTLAQYRQRMLSLRPDVGRAFTITGVGTQKVTVSRAAVGTVGPARYTRRWAVRPDAATAAGADRERMINDYNPFTGEFHHDGAAYADTSAGTEKLEVLEYEPFLYDDAIQETLRNTRFLDDSILPANLSGEYWLNGLSWLKAPSDIVRIGTRAIPVLSRNRHFEKWNTISSAGLLQPDDYTVAGSGGTFTRSTTARRGAYALSATRSGTNLTITQTIGLLPTGVSNDSLIGKTVTAVMVCKTSTASAGRVALSDGVTTTNSSYHTGGGGWEELTASAEIGATGTDLTIQGQVNVDGTLLIDELYLVYGSLTDTIRRSGFREPDWYQQAPRFEQQGMLLHGPRAIGSQVVVRSQRPYAQFDADRVFAGSADADEHDAPIELIAHGALWHLYDRVNKPEDAERHRRIYKSLAAQHLYDDSDDGSGFLPTREHARIMARVGR